MLPNCFPYHFGKRGFHDFDEEHDLITERLRKTLYYGKNPTTDRPSLPLTEIAVEFFNEAAPRQLGKLDTYMASSSSRQTCMSPCSMMMGMLYIKRLRRHNMDYLQKISSSDLFLISVMMASKFIYDEGVDDEVFNDEWAAAADLETEDINELERQFLSAIDWKLFISNEEFEHMLTQIEKRIALGQGLDRGWYSYTDMLILTKDLKCLKLWNDLGREMLQMLTASIVAYLAGILVMVGSTVIVTCMSTALLSIRPITSTLPAQAEPPVLVSHHLHDIGGIHHNDGLNTMEECNETGAKQEPPCRMEGTSAGKIDEGKANEQTFLSNVLSQLLAVVTLKDSYLEFLRAVRDRYMFSSGESFCQKHGMKDEILCADGPCLQNARKSCENVTKCVTLYSGHCRSCLNKRQSGNEGLQTGCMREYPSHSHPKEHDFTSGDGFEVRCCCSTQNYQSQELLDPGSLYQTFSDISLGFMTGPHNTPWPILGQT